MKLKFNSDLDYQIAAVSAVTGLFEGQLPADPVFSVVRTKPKMRTTHSDQHEMKAESELLCMPNTLVLGQEQILDNLHKIQIRNDIEKINALQGMNFSVEMETGTGKTYVYLRTIMELNKLYGFTKFVIVVPSIAIREGVKKSIDITRDHLEALYNTRINAFVYSPTAYGSIRQFATDASIQVMVVNIQAFQKDTNLMHRETDRLSGFKPIDFFQLTRPILILDEPQNMESEGARTALQSFQPLCTLRYSATHKNLYNQVYRLDPIKAYDLRLVKRIEVDFPVVDDNSITPDAYVKVDSIDNKNGFKAKLRINVQENTGPKRKPITVKLGDDLLAKSKDRAEYKSGWQVQNISLEPGFEGVTFNSGVFVPLGQELGGLVDDIMQLQVRETVRRHLEKEKRLQPKGIKVLSLFFIDRVANYRVYNPEGGYELGKIGKWFEEAFQELTAVERYRDILPWSASEVHDGYFAQDKKSKGYKDSTGRESKDDEDTFKLIMQDKERLLDPREPLRFIFSHSALREGWDNPNVFQICTLNESASTDKKRQEIGRGLRLPVNCDGERVHDEAVNVLTVVANENYNDFVRKLQTEYEEDCGISFGKLKPIAFARLEVGSDLGEQTEDGQWQLGQDESKKLWQFLQEQGILDEEGRITAMFRPDLAGFVLHLPEELKLFEAEIIDIINSYILQNRIPDARKRVQIHYNKHVEMSEDFRELWSRISKRTRYRVTFSTDELVKRAASALRDADKIKPLNIVMEQRVLNISQAGVEADSLINQEQHKVSQSAVLPDILQYLQAQTELTRSTLAQILIDSSRLRDFYVNPQVFLNVASREINRVMRNMMLDGIQYEPIDSHWEMMRLEKDAEQELSRYLNNLYKIQNQDKCLYDQIEFDSEVEHRFARDLDNNEQIKLFMKLPVWFKVDTPVGSYNPDWAIVVTLQDFGQERLYLVRETKSTKDAEERRCRENQKISCGKKHFKAIDVDFKVATNIRDIFN